MKCIYETYEKLSNMTFIKGISCCFSALGLLQEKPLGTFLHCFLTFIHVFPGNSVRRCSVFSKKQATPAQLPSSASTSVGDGRGGGGASPQSQPHSGASKILSTSWTLSIVIVLAFCKIWWKWSEMKRGILTPKVLAGPCVPAAGGM